MIGVGGGAAGNHPYQVAGDDSVGGRAAGAFLGTFTKRINPAGAHHADATAEAEFTETTLGLLFFEAVPDGFNILVSGQL